MPTTRTNDPVEVLAQLLESRRSCRAFRDEEAPESVLKDVLSFAQRAPSSCNTQPWFVNLLSGRKLRTVREKCMSAPPGEPDIEFPESYDGIFGNRRRESGWQLYDALGVQRGDRESSAREAARNFSFFGAPHVAIISTDQSLGPYALVDCGIYLQALILSAEAFGLATCVQASVAKVARVLHQELELPSDRLIVCGVAIGMADSGHPSAQVRTSRASINDAVVFQRSIAADALPDN